MCGLFGYSGKDVVDPLRLTFLAAENQSRGDDSTGVYGHFLAKSIKKAKDFIVTPEFKAAIEGANNVIGHTRKATVGYKIEANAHPFEVVQGMGKEATAVVGTHNGQIFSQCLEQLQKKYDLEKTDVDSEFIYKFMLHNKFDYDKTLSELEGAMALAFIRPDLPEYLYLYHRDSRPLAVGFINGNMYYSSETEPLDLIGCVAIEPLATDQLYIFKNGGLVEVSPVKKPQLTLSIEDQSITAWLATATDREKAVLGIRGADVKKSKTVTDYPSQRWLTEKTGGGTGATDGGQSSGFPQSRLGNLQLLESIPIGLYSDEESIRPPKVGRFYAAGHNSSCYLIALLHSSTDDKLGLPAWYVRVANRPDINAISTHNGIVALEIPNDLCGAPIKLEMINPLQQAVVYKVLVNKPAAGKVLEVALSIPFRCTEAKKEGSEGEEALLASASKLTRQKEGRFSPFSSFSAFFNAFKSSQLVLQTLQRHWLDEIPRRSHNQPSPIHISNDVVEISNGKDEEERGMGVFSGEPSPNLGPLEGTYDEKTDILDMNYYTALTNLAEVKAHQRKIEELLSQSDPDIRDLKETLLGVRNYLTFEEGYLESRTKRFEESQEEDEANRYAVTE